MNTPNNHYLKILFTWHIQSCQIETENEGTIPIIVNGYWEGLLNYSNFIFQNWAEVFVQSVLNKNVFNKGVYILKTLDSIPECIYSGCEAPPSNGVKDGDHCIRMAIGKEGVFGKEVIVKEGKIDIDFSRKETIHSLSDDFIQRLYCQCIPTDKVTEILKYTTLIGKAMKILMDSHTTIYDKSGNPFYMHPLRVALACETPDQIQVALLHEAVEDDQYTYDDLLELGFSDEVITASAAISQGIDEDFDSYNARCSRNPLARYVKIRELKDNIHSLRQNPTPDSEKTISLYLNALHLLEKNNECRESRQNTCIIQ